MEVEGKGESSGLQDRHTADGTNWATSWSNWATSQSSSRSVWGAEDGVGGRVAEITWEQSSARGLGVLLGVPVHQLFLRLMVLEPLWALHPWPSRTPSPPSLVSFSCPDSPTSSPPTQTFVFILLLTQLHTFFQCFTHICTFSLWVY